MEPFRVVATFAFEAETIEAAGREIRKLSEAAAAAGFSIQSAQVEPMPPEKPESAGGTAYGPAA